MLDRRVIAQEWNIFRIPTIVAVLGFALFCFISPTKSAAEAKLNCVAAPKKCGYFDSKKAGIKTIVKKKKKKRVIKRKKLRGKKKYKFKKVKFKTIPDDVQSGDGWRWDSRGWVSINKEGANFENYIVKGTVDVEEDNVTIRNVKIIESGCCFGIAIRSANNTVIDRCEISPAPGEERLTVAIKDIDGDAQNTIISRCDISGVSTGIHIPRGKIINNYIHDLGYKDGDHLNGITTNGSTDLLIIDHNTIFNQYGQTDAIGLFQDFGLEANRIVRNNFLAGGGYTLYAGQNPGAEATYNIKVYNNRFSNKYFPKGGYYGPATAYLRNGDGNVWKDNFWDHSGSNIPAP